AAERAAVAVEAVAEPAVVPVVAEAAAEPAALAAEIAAELFAAAVVVVGAVAHAVARAVRLYFVCLAACRHGPVPLLVSLLYRPGPHVVRMPVTSFRRTRGPPQYWLFS